MLTHFVRFKQLKKHFQFYDVLSLTLGIKNKRESIKLTKLRRSLYFRRRSKDLETFKEIFLNNLYDIPLPFTPRTIVDAGANVGFASLFFKMKYPESQVVAIEIEQENIAYFKKNTKGLSDVKLCEKALYNEKAYFKIEDPYHATNSFQVRPVSGDDPYDIEAVTLDQIMADQKWDTIDVLKIDVEGAEKQLFEKNYENWLPKTKVIMVETHDRMLGKCSYTVMNTINAYNFILYTTTEGTLIYYNLDWVALPQQ